jgi:hypothetical protein
MALQPLEKKEKTREPKTEDSMPEMGNERAIQEVWEGKREQTVQKNP